MCACVYVHVFQITVLQLKVSVKDRGEHRRRGEIKPTKKDWCMELLYPGGYHIRLQAILILLDVEIFSSFQTNLNILVLKDTENILF